MKLAVRRTLAATAAVATAGVSSVFLGAAPAYAASEACGPSDGVLIAPGVCELVLTSGTSSFTPTAQMTQLEVLLVGAGGAGADQPEPNTNGYAAAGGGGDVRLVDFSGTTDPLTITVAEPGTPATPTDPAVAGVTGNVTNGSTTETAASGTHAAYGDDVGGASGNGFPGANGISSTSPYGGGAGAAGSPSGNQNGGAGVIVGDLASAGSLFDTDTRCFGGGGAIGNSTLQGVAGCGGGAPTDATATALTVPTANSGSGGGGLNITQPLAARQGASGVAILRWTAANVVLSFNANGHGAAPASQSIVAGNAATRPADPAAAGFAFRGWFTDASLTTPADFSAPVTASTTYFASWALPVTGADLNPLQIPLAVGGLAAGAALLVLASRRTRREI